MIWFYGQKKQQQKKHKMLSFGRISSTYCLFTGNYKVSGLCSKNKCVCFVPPLTQLLWSRPASWLQMFFSQRQSKFSWASVKGFWVNWMPLKWNELTIHLQRQHTGPTSQVDLDYWVCWSAFSLESFCDAMQQVIASQQSWSCGDIVYICWTLDV